MNAQYEVAWGFCPLFLKQRAFLLGFNASVKAIIASSDRDIAEEMKSAGFTIATSKVCTYSFCQPDRRRTVL